MFTVNVKNRIPELSRRLDSGLVRVQVNGQIMHSLQTGGQLFLQEFMKNTPDGSRWTETPWTTKAGRQIDHGRPSLRLYGMTMAQGWEAPPVEPLSDGGIARVINRAPHAAMQMTGTEKKDYPIMPRNAAVLAWWRISESDAPIVTAQVTHPGYPANRRLLDAAERATHILNDLGIGAMDRAFFDPLRTFLKG